MTLEPDTDVSPILEVNEFYALITKQLESEFGSRSPFWIRGEIQKLYEKGHLYLDVVDASGNASSSKTRAAVLKAHCWQSKWSSLRSRLATEGVVLEAGSVVRFFGYVDVYEPSATIGFTVTDIDVQALLGDAAKRREELIAKLRDEGLLESNKQRILSPVPLRVGLVASKGTEGFRDFIGQLKNADVAFEVSHVQASVQGDAAPNEVVNALWTLDQMDLDVICVVRGGGSKGDLSCFDDERIARAIATARLPVMTGIGHTGDTSIADLVAFHSAITPTELGAALANKVLTWRENRVRRPAEHLAQAADAIVEEATVYVGERRRTMTFAVRDRLTSEKRHLDHVRASVSTQSRFVLEHASNHLLAARQLLTAYDPQRRLAQGWSITTNDAGATVKSIADVNDGETITVRVSDGSLKTEVRQRIGDA